MGRRLPLGSGFLALGLAGTALGLQEPRELLFEAKIRPLLVENCLECHAGLKPKGGLDLRTPEGWLRGGDLGPALVPGDPQGSLLLRAVRYQDPDLAMPPRGRLEPSQVALLEEWIAAGAPAPSTPAPELASATRPRRPENFGSDHWAFQPLREPQASPLEAEFPGGAAWAKNPIDRLIAAGLDSAGLPPAPRADRRTLARRTSQLLTGLYLDEAQLEAFLTDPGTDFEALGRLVDRLIESPHYGERMARHWLDLVRYADSNGLDENIAMAEAWRYRDWVVAAFNRGLPFDVFARAQIAGDLLPEAEDQAKTFDNWTATGFWLLGPKMLAEQDQEKLAMDIVDEQLDVFSKTFLGLTISCARCHDHKFDPISAQDYYALAGVLRSTDVMESLETVARWRERELLTHAQAEQNRIAADRIAELEAKLAAYQRSSQEAARSGWRTDLARIFEAGLELRPQLIFLEGEAGQTNLGPDDQQWGSPEVLIVHSVAGGTQTWAQDLAIDAPGRFALLARYASQEPRPMRLSLDGTVVEEQALGQGTGGYFPAHQLWQQVAVLELERGPHRLQLEREGPVPHLDKLALIPLPESGPLDDAFTALENLAGEPRRQLGAALLLRSADWVGRPTSAALLGPLLQRVVAGETGAPASPEQRAGWNPISAEAFEAAAGNGPQALADRLAQSANSIWRSAERAQAAHGEFMGFDDPAAEAWRRALASEHGLFQFSAGESLRPADPEGESVRAELDSAKAVPMASGARILSVQEGAPIELQLHVRGSHLNLAGDPIPRGTPQILERCLPGIRPPPDQSGRLELADWLFDRRNPLTARVFVNRLWAQVFGQGLVSSPSNFGLRGSSPSHPELLDWLAREFIESGWSMQHMQRLMLASEAYAQVADVPLERVEQDPENRWLGRFRRQRLSAEALRDGLLSAAGLLDASLGGSLLSTRDRDYVTNDQSANQAGYDAPRRSLYLPIVRNAMYGFFSSFDYADPSLPIEQRSETTVPAQALQLINSPLAARAGRGAAERALLGTDQQPRAQIAALYRTVLQRPPLEAELELCERFLQSAAAVPSPGEAPPADPTAPPRALARLANVLLCSSEFLYLD